MHSVRDWLFARAGSVSQTNDSATHCRCVGFLMKTVRLLSCAVFLSLTAAWAQQPDQNLGGAGTAQPRPALGTITGLVRDAAKQPVGGATITATRLDGSAIRSTISDSNGIYSFADTPAGTYSLATQVDGFADTSVASLEVVGGRATRLDVQLTNTAAVASNHKEQTANATSSAQNNVIPTSTSAQTASAASSSVLPPALATPAPGPAVDNQTPFAFGDFTWLNGNPRTKDTVLDTAFFTPEIRFDTNFIVDFNQPKDHTMGGSTEEFRSGEIQVEQASVGGDFHWQNVRGRILFMMGMFATTTPRNDASAAVGQWDLRDAYRYVSEAYGGYHFNVNHGLNVDAGIFASYVGLFSYYNFDNWTYQPSYVSSNTPWFFSGVRIQWFPTNKLKIEPWIINGWQSYAKYNGHPGLGGQILYRPKEWLSLVFNQYGYGQDNLGLPRTQRIHTDDSIEVRYYNNPENGLSKAALTTTFDAGCQYGGGITCIGGANKSSFVGWMGYNRFWFHRDTYAVTLGGGLMNNPGRYLTLLPPINGADAISGSTYFTELPGEKAHMWDSTVTFQWMPRQYITWWGEVGYRHSDVPYFSGRGGITPPGGNNGAPQDYACMSGASVGTADPNAAQTACANSGGVWYPDLRRSTSSIGFGVMVKF